MKCHKGRLITKRGRADLILTRRIIYERAGGYEGRIRGLFTCDCGPARLGSRNVANGTGEGLAWTLMAVKCKIQLCMKLSILKIEPELRHRAKHEMHRIKIDKHDLTADLDLTYPDLMLIVLGRMGVVQIVYCAAICGIYLHTIKAAAACFA